MAKTVSFSSRGVCLRTGWEKDQNSCVFKVKSNLRRSDQVLVVKQFITSLSSLLRRRASASQSAAEPLSCCRRGGFVVNRPRFRGCAFCFCGELVFCFEARWSPILTSTSRRHRLCPTTGRPQLSRLLVGCLCLQASAVVKERLTFPIRYSVNVFPDAEEHAHCGGTQRGTVRGLERRGRDAARQTFDSASN